VGTEGDSVAPGLSALMDPEPLPQDVWSNLCASMSERTAGDGNAGS